MKHLSIVITISAITCHAQFVESATRSLYSDVKAFRKGDVVTILIVEDAQADNQAATQNNTSTELSAQASGTIGNNQGNVSVGIGTQNTFNGRGATNRSERVRAKLTARIVDASNLNALQIEGTRSVTINGETQTITLRGYVRFVDISPDNTVYSFQIADLVLIYNGEGVISRAQEPGLFTRFIRLLF
ncbi:MAG: flagellar basal body L-ring protein FlgH [Bacteroidota bacterium]|nr:flagellar basal body L-ring protein FlgH [Candidatus Kapabacteria bacterium]MCS7302176.1 flagellar basal body L-ring protein FlgH [Candidatus Kapabacteria bacterium]MCX7936395.1 flagellar basal body L-ring protein FlgH [Chlorobiota bacterium]MDW8074325.1 flagellar basal body L-ring protein FlgH [Bacteroidota bacterium]MDW8271199.1 flagellar basal body L-ring protein FlgH [Bacteroidota bacterium]